MDQDALSDICTRCGMCCDGTLFDYGELTVAETASAQAAGLRVYRFGEKARFRQPCSQLVGNRCGAYGVRPGICRSYRCKLLKDLDHGTIVTSEAVARVVEAQALIARIRDALPPGQDIASARDEWAQDHRAQRDQGDTPVRKDPKLTLALFMLNRFLDRHFRSAHQRMMSDWDTDPAKQE